MPRPPQARRKLLGAALDLFRARGYAATTVDELCEAAGVTQLSPHKLRHSYASLMGARGVPVEVLSAQLGHSNASVTRDVYRHVYDVEREGLTFDPVPPAPRAALRVTVKARRATARASEPAPPAVPSKPRRAK